MNVCVYIIMLVNTVAPPTYKHACTHTRIKRKSQELQFSLFIFMCC